MKLETVQSVVALACALNLGAGQGAGFAASPAIGTVAAQGSFRVDGATVAGNATLFEGTTVETRQSGTLLDLVAGPRVSLGAESQGRIFGDRLVLEKGWGEMHDAAGFRVEARGLSVRTGSGGSAGRILLAGSTRVQVAALAGSLRVLNSHGLLVAALDSGTALEFDPQASSEQEELTGCLRVAGGHYLLTDEVTNVTVEVAGPGLDRERGNHVEVTGVMDPAAAPVSGATQYIHVTRLKRIGKGCRASRAAAAGAGGNAGGSPPGSSGGAAGKAGGAAGGSGGIAGLSVTTLAVIGGVAAAAAIGGLAATGSLSSSGSTLSR